MFFARIGGEIKASLEPIKSPERANILALDEASKGVENGGVAEQDDMQKGGQKAKTAGSLEE